MGPGPRERYNETLSRLLEGGTAMRNGPIAMFDALGFKGIWKKHDPDDVLNKLKRLREHSRRIPDAFGGARPTGSMLESVDIALLSDTVVVALGVTSTMRSLKSGGPIGLHEINSLALYFLCEVVSTFLYEAALDDPTLAYRGSISHGDYAIEDSFVVGPAVDDAAEHMNLPHGAMVCLTPQALGVIENVGIINADPSVLVEHKVPVAGGDVFRTHVVNPLANADAGACEPWIARLLASFDAPTVRVRSLRDNTEAFLRSAARRPQKNVEG